MENYYDDVFPTYNSDKLIQNYEIYYELTSSICLMKDAWDENAIDD